MNPALWLAPALLWGAVSLPDRSDKPTAAPIVFTGICDASAVVALSDDLFVVADDEDNRLRVYSRSRGGAPAAVIDLTWFLRAEKKAPEVDIEGAARLGERIYWISSHGRNAKGKERTSRHCFFATTGSLRRGAVEVRPVGQPYRTLLRDLVREPRLARFRLASAAALPPKSEAALNIEGLCATPAGHLLIGFRNPIPDGKALLVPLVNPAELVRGKPARFGDPLLLDLQGRGIRSITGWRDRYLIIAGAHGAGGQSQLYEWLGGADIPCWIPEAAFAGLNPEAITVFGEPGAEQLLLVSDDGTVKVGGQDCKRLKDASLKQFRAVCAPLPSGP